MRTIIIVLVVAALLAPVVVFAGTNDPDPCDITGATRLYRKPQVMKHFKALEPEKRYRVEYQYKDWYYINQSLREPGSRLRGWVKVAGTQQHNCFALPVRDTWKTRGRRK